MNSSNRNLNPSEPNWTLNNKIHRAAGPELRKECSNIGKIKVTLSLLSDSLLRSLLQVSQSALTGGYQLPCTHIIHVARPHYSSKKGMGQYNLLTEGYRGVLRLALHHSLKTIAFCCLGAGGVGFPARIAARIALQETREFLDAHQTHSFERIIFCVFDDYDSAAYTEFFPVFFPPTPEDLENTVSNKESRDDTNLSVRIQEIYTQVDSVAQKIMVFGTGTTSASHHVAHELSKIAVLLENLKEFCKPPNEGPGHMLSRTTRYLDILCTVLLAFCNNMTEMIELAKGKENLGKPSYKTIWDDYNDYMGRNQGMTITQLILSCRKLAQQIVKVLEQKQNTSIPHEIEMISTELNSWLTKRNEEGPQSTRDYFEYALLARREYERDSPAKGRSDTLKLYQVPTLAQLYEIGTMQTKNTQAVASSRSNDIVCLTRQDITKLEVDILGRSYTIISSLILKQGSQ